MEDWISVLKIISVLAWNCIWLPVITRPEQYQSRYHTMIKDSSNSQNSIPWGEILLSPHSTDRSSSEIFHCFIEICGLVVCFVLSHFRLMTNSKQLEAFLKIFLFDLMTCQSNQSGFGGQTSNSRSLFKTCRRRRWRRRPTRWSRQTPSEWRPWRL